MADTVIGAFTLFRPGGSLNPGEDEMDGLKRILDEKLGSSTGQTDQSGGEPEKDMSSDWSIGECLATWYRPNFETFMVSFLFQYEMVWCLLDPPTTHLPHSILLSLRTSPSQKSKRRYSSLIYQKNVRQSSCVQSSRIDP